MPSIYYQRQFIPGSYYHVYNRGANKQDIFHSARDYEVYTQIMSYYLLHPTGTAQSILARLQDKNKVTNLANDPSSCTLLAYCLMPNHFHLLLHQEESELTISDFMRRLSVTYAMYYNHAHHHSGAIYQGRYKNVTVTNEYQWLYLSKYIHRNPLHLQQSYEPCKLKDYAYSSYPNYIDLRIDQWVQTSPILDRHTHDSFGQYQRFVEDGSDTGNIEKYTLDAEELQY